MIVVPSKALVCEGWPPDLEDWDGLLQSANDTYNPLAGKETQVLITWGSFVCMSLLMTLWSM